MVTYKTVDVQQGSPEWLLWRNGHDNASVTATLAGSLMGVSQYLDINAAWEDRLGIKKLEYIENSNVRHGTENEAHAMSELMKATGISFTSACVESLEFPFLKASLDGLNIDHKLVAEIKCPVFYGSFRKHQAGILDYYYAQVQAQLLVTGFEHALFFSYFEGSDELKVIKANQEYQKELLKRAILFHVSVIKRLPLASELFYRYEI